jgi:hypothetical protein
MCVAGHAPDQDVDADGGAGCPGISDDISDVPDDLNGSLSGTYDPSAVVLAMMKPTREDNQRVRRILAVIAALLIAAVLAVPAQAALHLGTSSLAVQGSSGPWCSVTGERTLTS